MTRISFYLLSAGNMPAVTCRLVEKAYQKNMRILIHTDSAETTQQLDDLMWTFKEDGFLPHSQTPDNMEDCPIIISHQQSPENLPGNHSHTLLINLSSEIPDCFSQFERVAEIVPNMSESKEKARDKYRFYRDRGYTLETHKL